MSQLLDLPDILPARQPVKDGLNVEVMNTRQRDRLVRREYPSDSHELQDYDIRGVFSFSIVFDYLMEMMLR